MKNLKKVGAVALAAVMAVTFAPVASLNVFAAQTVSKGGYVAFGDTISGTGTYYIDNKSLAAGGSITIADVAGDITLDLNGQQKVTVVASGITKDVNLTIVDTDGGFTDATGATKGWGDLAGITDSGTLKSINFKGNVIVDSDPRTIATKTGFASIGSTPMARLTGGTAYYLGKAISDLAGAGDISAENGSVVINGLENGQKADIARDSEPGTDLSVTSAEGVSLTSIVETYTIKYDGKNDAGRNQKGTETVVYKKFVGGNADPSTQVTGISDIDDDAAHNSIPKKSIEGFTNIFSDGDGANAIKSFTYDRAITLTEKKDNEFTTVKTPVDAVNADNTAKFGVGDDKIAGISYLTNDPTAWEKSTFGIAVVDGNKYIVSDAGVGTNAISHAAVMAKSSVQVLRGTAYNADKKNAKAKETFTLAGQDDVTVSAASDMNVVEKVYEADSKSNPVKTRKVAVFGTDTTVATTGDGDDVDKQKKAAGTYSRTLKLVQAADDALVTVDKIRDDFDNVERSAGLDYYSLSSTTPDCNTYVFGATEDATQSFKDALGGVKTATRTIEPTIDDTNDPVFASSGIVCQVPNVKKSVQVRGEVSAQVASVEADGTVTWDVNGGNINTPQNVYRLRAKVGNNHLFTMDTTEANNAVASGNWVLESAEAFKMLPSNTTRADAVKVLRFRNVKTNEFLFSTDPAEQAAKLADPEWAEGYVAFCGVKDNTTGYPVTRLFSTIGQGHLYSTAQAEVKSAVEKDHYVKDGVVFFALETPEKEK